MAEEKESVQVELVSKDGQKFKVDKEVITMSGLVKDMLEEADEEEDETPSIPVPNVDSKPLQKVIEYCQYHHKNPAEEIEKPLKGKIEDVICDWDKKFLEIDQSLLIELIMAANYLNIKDLLDLTCAKVASMIKGKSPEQIREMFGIENDFTPEEEAKIREENKWCEEA
jgi:S-phase kinase-associated protein 1